MKYISCIVALTIWSFILYFSVRSFIYSVISYKLNKSAYKKRKNNQNLIEWFFYIRFRDVVPKIMLIWYFGHILLYFVSVFIVAFMALLGIKIEIVRIVCEIVFAIEVIPGLICYFMFRRIKHRDWQGVSRWVDRHKRNK